MKHHHTPIEVPLGEDQNAEVIRFLPIPAGTFRMGARGESVDEEPATEVAVDAFWIAETPVTQAQYRVMAEGCLEELQEIEGNKGPEPSDFKGRPDSNQRPVENVNWHEARVVASWLTERMRELGKLPAGYVVDLPGEAQCCSGRMRLMWWCWTRWRLW